MAGRLDHGEHEAVRDAEVGGAAVPYSLVSAATLGFDLVRLPAGRDVAGVLLTAMDAGAAELRRLAAAHPARGRTAEQRGVLAVRSRRARELAAEVPHLRTATAALAEAVGDRTAVLVDQLERGTIGNAPNLERLLREDVLGPEHAAVGAVDDDVRDQAADVLADAAVGFWAAEVLPPLVRRELTAPLGAAALPPRPLPDLGPATPGLTELLGALRGLDETGRARWRTAVDEGRAEHRSWAGAMHEAAWAAHVAGRTRALATAQLAAVQAFLDGGLTGRDGAHGVWNAVAGCVQGLAMADLLDDGSVALLRAPWARVTG
jgi:hypothetical protein